MPLVRIFTLALIAIAPSPTAATQCGYSSGCYLKDLNTGKEHYLDQYDSYKYKKGHEYSVVCDTYGDIDYVKFYYDGKTHKENYEPYWMGGNNDHSEFPVDYLEYCGTKHFEVAGYRHTKHGREECFYFYYKLEAKCDYDDGCGHGRKRDGSGYCVKEWCEHDYTCPKGYKRKSGRDCYNDKHDCKRK